MFMLLFFFIAIKTPYKSNEGKEREGEMERERGREGKREHIFAFSLRIQPSWLGNQGSRSETIGPIAYTES